MATSQQMAHLNFKVWRIIVVAAHAHPFLFYDRHNIFKFDILENILVLGDSVTDKPIIISKYLHVICHFWHITCRSIAEIHASSVTKIVHALKKLRMYYFCVTESMYLRYSWNFIGEEGLYHRRRHLYFNAMQLTLAAYVY